MKYHVLYNPLCCYGLGEQEAHKISRHLYSDKLEFYDMTKIQDYSALLSGFEEDSAIVICGGDGTLNRFVNDKKNYEVKQQIYYYATGASTDFMTDLGGNRMDPPVNITKYLRNLPIATINGRDYYFLNNVGFGLDGYTTYEADKLIASGAGKINFAMIALKGMFSKFKPFNSSITVNGDTRTFRKCYISTTMQGRYYGGGMNPTPEQDRLNRDRHVSTIVLFNCGPFRTMTVFPSFFKGTHLKYSNICKIFTGHDIHVSSDRPCAIQVDGETIGYCTEYRVRVTL
ncbi:MAG: diacylglycerol kinase family protein [Lachnospiraceae bacterium]|nr:diacylglycerol kinase family protein [Lachnospiraceae bacterium]